MEIRNGETEGFLSLSPVGYQFPDITDDQWDSNWLMIRGTARTPDEEWTFEDPAMTVHEAVGLGVWLHDVAAGRATLIEDDEDSHVWRGATQNLEPNIGLGLVQSTEDSATLRVFLWAESGPPSVQRDDQLSDMEFFFDLTTSRAAIERAAEEWDSELVKFPERGDPSRR